MIRPGVPLATAARRANSILLGTGECCKRVSSQIDNLAESQTISGQQSKASGWPEAPGFLSCCDGQSLASRKLLSSQQACTKNKVGGSRDILVSAGGWFSVELALPAETILEAVSNSTAPVHRLHLSKSQ